MQKGLKTVKISNKENFSFDDRLKLFLNYALDNYDDCMIQHEKESDKTFGYLIDLFEFNGYPKIAPENAFEKIQEKTLYRGVQNKDFIANILCDFNYHYGTGFLNGIYSSENLQTAQYYAFTRNQVTHQKIYDPSLVLKFKFVNAFTCSDEFVAEIFTELVNDEEIYSWLYHKKAYEFNNEFEKIKNNKYITDMLNSNEPNIHEIGKRISKIKKSLLSLKSAQKISNIMEIFDHDISKLAVLLGIDGLTDINNSVIVLNRSKMVVPHSELVRFVENSKKYNFDGTINFEKQ